MKKVLNLIMVCILMVSMLAGCTGKSTKSEKEASNESQPLKVAMDLKYPPFTSRDDSGNPEGLEVDIANALGAYLGRKVEIIDTDFSMLITSLDTGESDVVIGEMTVNEERKEKVDFSDPYLYDHTLALVNKDFAQANNITDDMSPEDFFALKGAKFAGLAGTIAVSIPQGYGLKVEELTELASVLTEIDNGTADIFVGANSILGCHAAYPDSTIVYSGIKDYSTCAMAVKKGNTELLKDINAFVKSMYEDGGFYKEAGDKYDEAIGNYLQDTTKGLDYIVYPPTGAK